MKDFRNAKIIPDEIVKWKLFFIKLIQNEFYSKNKPFIIDEKNKNKLALCFDWVIGNVDVNLNKGLLLRGGIGTGKSAIIKACRTLCTLLYNVNSVYITADEISRLYRDNSEVSEKTINKIMTCKLLFIDDIGYEAYKVFDHYPIPEVIRERYDKKRITCMTTNMTMDEIAAKYQSSFEDKLNEMSFIVKFDGDSKR